MNFRYSGHESFPCRYAWLPKAYKALCQNPLTFNDEDKAMVELGVGKNMVRAIRFWVQVCGIAEVLPDRRGYSPTSLGHTLFASNGFDPYLEDIQTLWLLHWKMSSLQDDALFAWHFLLNKWPHPELSRTEVIAAFRKETQLQDKLLSDVTLEQHFDVFLHTYVPTRGRKGEVVEDNLDCPLTELRLLVPVAERPMGEAGRREVVYSFRREDKPDISGELVAYCLHDFWQKFRSSEGTMSFRDTAVVPSSVGQVFKIPEGELRDRLESLGDYSDGLLGYRPSESTPQVRRTYQLGDEEVTANLLCRIYNRSMHDYLEIHAQRDLEAPCPAK